MTEHITLDDHAHPLHSITSVDGRLHSLSQNRREGPLLLGSVRRRDSNGRYYFYPMGGVFFSDTQLWQLLCYVSALNEKVRREDLDEYMGKSSS